MDSLYVIIYCSNCVIHFHEEAAKINDRATQFATFWHAFHTHLHYTYVYHANKRTLEAFAVMFRKKCTAQLCGCNICCASWSTASIMVECKFAENWGFVNAKLRRNLYDHLRVYAFVYTNVCTYMYVCKCMYIHFNWRKSATCCAQTLSDVATYCTYYLTSVWWWLYSSAEVCNSQS